MVSHNPEGGVFTGAIGDPDTYCMTTEQIGEILAAAFLKSHEAFLQALTFYIVISLIIGILIGAGAMYLKSRLDAAETAADEAAAEDDR
jgi:hypothetical protein